MRIKNWIGETEELPFDRASDILSDGLLEWRSYFIRYLERARQSVEPEKRIELPLEAKKRIGDTIAEALQKDVVAGRGKVKR